MNYTQCTVSFCDVRGHRVYATGETLSSSWDRGKLSCSSFLIFSGDPVNALELCRDKAEEGCYGGELHTLHNTDMNNITYPRVISQFLSLDFIMYNSYVFCLVHSELASSIGCYMLYLF